MTRNFRAVVFSGVIGLVVLLGLGCTSSDRAELTQRLAAIQSFSDDPETASNFIVFPFVASFQGSDFIYSREQLIARSGGVICQLGSGVKLQSQEISISGKLALVSQLLTVKNERTDGTIEWLPATCRFEWQNTPQGWKALRVEYEVNIDG